MLVAHSFEVFYAFIFSGIGLAFTAYIPFMSHIVKVWPGATAGDPGPIGADGSASAVSFPGCAVAMRPWMEATLPTLLWISPEACRSQWTSWRVIAKKMGRNATSCLREC